MALKIYSRKLSKSFLSGLQNTVLGRLEVAGTLQTPARTQVAGVFLPWLITEVDKRLHSVEASHRVLDELLSHSVGQALKEVQDAQEAEKQQAFEEETRLAAVLAERERQLALKAARDAPQVEVIDYNVSGADSEDDDTNDA